MSDFLKPLAKEEEAHYNVLNKENIEFLMNRYNKSNRWVIADMIRRAAVPLPGQEGHDFGDRAHGTRKWKMSVTGLPMRSPTWA